MIGSSRGIVKRSPGHRCTPTPHRSVSRLRFSPGVAVSHRWAARQDRRRGRREVVAPPCRA